MKKLFTFSLIYLFLLPAVQAQIAPVFTAHLQYMVDSICKKNKIKGASVAVLIKGSGIWTGSYGESETGVPIMADMYQCIGSNTKTFTAAMLLKLQENGQLSINDTIGTWFTGIANINGQITIKQLLNHTSGLYDYTTDPGFSTALNADYAKLWQAEDMYQFIKAPVAAPGAPFKYCNTNYLLAGIIIEKVTGKAFNMAIRDMILTPLGLTETITHPAESVPTSTPHLWTANVTGKLEDMMVTYGYTHTAFLSMAGGAGAMMSTPRDNVKFWDALMSGNIINATSLAQMTECFTPNGDSYGLGVMRYENINGKRIYCHGGTVFGGLNENLSDTASGIFITVLTNQDSIGNSATFNRIVRPLHKYLLTLPPAAVNEVVENTEVVIFPNPATDKIQLRLQNVNKNARFMLCDITGKILRDGQVANGSCSISCDGLTGGIYIARVIADGQPVHTERIVIQR